VSIIYLEEGGSFIFKGLVDAPFPKGTMVTIMQNGLGEKSIVAAKDAQV